MNSYSDYYDSDSDSYYDQQNINGKRKRKTTLHEVVPKKTIKVISSAYEDEMRKKNHADLLLKGKRYHDDFLKQPPMAPYMEKPESPKQGSLALLKFKLKQPNAKNLFTEDELAGYSHNTVNMHLDPNEWNTLFDIVCEAIKSASPSRLNSLRNLKQSLYDFNNDSVKRRLLFQGGKSGSRTMKKCRNNRRNTRKQRKTRK